MFRPAPTYTNDSMPLRIKAVREGMNPSAPRAVTNVAAPRAAISTVQRPTIGAAPKLNTTAVSSVPQATTAATRRAVLDTATARIRPAPTK